MQPDKIIASKLLGTSYSPVSLVYGATVCTCRVELPVSHFYMHYDDVMICPLEPLVNTTAPTGCP